VRAYADIWYLLEAGIAAASGSTIALTIGDVETGDGYWVYSAFYTGVKQSAPIDATGSGTTTSSDTVTTSAGLSTTNEGYVLACATCGTTGTGYAPNNSFVERADDSTPTVDGAASARFTVIDKAATGASETPSVTFSTSANRQAIAAIALAPEVAAPSDATLRVLQSNLRWRT
jgi:hypothetical protein